MRDAEEVGRKLDWHQFKTGSITPTDLDFSMDYHGVAWLLAEIKRPGTGVPDGQLKHLVRHAISHALHGTFTIAAIVSSPLNGSLDMRDCTVRRYWYLNEWFERPCNFHDLFNWWSAWAQKLEAQIEKEIPRALIHPDSLVRLVLPEGWPPAGRA